MKHIILFLLLALALFSCHKKEAVQQDLCAEPALGNTCVTDTTRLKSLIVGKWHWTQSISSWTMQKTNPCTDTINRSYEFLTGNQVKYFENGVYVSTGTYQFNNGYTYSLYVNIPQPHFGFSGGVTICDNYLVVDDSPVDGPKMIFVRAE
jgi:hypothetical protein